MNSQNQTNRMDNTDTDLLMFMDSSNTAEQAKNKEATDNRPEKKYKSAQLLLEEKKNELRQKVSELKTWKLENRLASSQSSCENNDEMTEAEKAIESRLAELRRMLRDSGVRPPDTDLPGLGESSRCEEMCQDVRATAAVPEPETIGLSAYPYKRKTSRKRNRSSSVRTSPSKREQKSSLPELSADRPLDLNPLTNIPPLQRNREEPENQTLSIVITCVDLEITSDDFQQFMAETNEMILMSTVTPRFTTFELIGSVILVTAFDNVSYQWLISRLPHLNIRRAPLRFYFLAPLGDDFLMVHMTVPGRNLLLKKVIDLLDKANKKLKVKNWRVVRCESHMDYLEVEAYIQTSSIKCLEKLGWQPFMGLARAKVRPALWLTVEQLYKKSGLLK